MLLKRPYLIFDTTEKVVKIKNLIKKKIKGYSLLKSDFFIVFGGDGFMLKTIKKFHKYKKPFYGINCGSYGFLMNKLNIKKIKNKSYRFNVVNINPLKINSIDRNKRSKSFFAINEISLFRQSKQVTRLNIKINRKNSIKNLVGDGILVSTPAGSTAYNFSANGPILNLNSGKLALTPINPFRPRMIKSKIISNKSIIQIKNLDTIKRPVSAVADNIEFRNISNLKVKLDFKNRIILLFDKNKSLINKNKIENLKKNILKRINK